MSVPLPWTAREKNRLKKEVREESEMLEKSCSVKNFNTDSITNKIPFD